ncbi:hypothetical protein Misp01_57950 [Microtetraspora sp. NBRC 13810]|uniref:hypothetical protein n=1 Tax=Microtetraspora sp. NBRC 13810 TaxID=3030990 RepID=UPI0024A32668|nr:hypothetical protein [Microtetraspora sp. NBRC 13810]GLW10667.1 hypothetical protein Misp01_57950 [Microtetraspora sp. NBRC 13810]
MRRNVRTGWIVASGLLTTLAVCGPAAAAWLDILSPPDTPRGFLLLSSTSSQTVEDVYRITSPEVVVDRTGQVEVAVARGPAGQITIRREVTWQGGPPDVQQFWNGRQLTVKATCDPFASEETVCVTRYTLTVPPGVKVTEVP